MTDSASSAGERTQALHVTAGGEGEAYWFYGNLALVRGPEGSRPVVIEMHLPQGSAAPLHYHERLEDNWYVVAGAIAVRDGEETALVRAGDYVTTRPGVPQTHYVVEGPAILLQVHAETDFVDFLRQFGTPVADRNTRPTNPIDFARGAEVAAATGQPVIGAPMTQQEAEAIAQRRAGS